MSRDPRRAQRSPARGQEAEELRGLEGLSAHHEDRPTVLIELCVGTSLRVAPMEFLEAAVTRVHHAMDGAERHADGGKICLRPAHMAVVSTCNRVEFYLAAEADAVEEMINSIKLEIFHGAADEVGLDAEKLVYVHHGTEAVRHLCRVAVGLDSLAIGEHQIAGQVSRAFARTVDNEGWSGALVAMAEAARRASGRARTETAIGRGSISLSSVAVDLAEREMGSLRGKRVLVIGAGKVGRLACSKIDRAGGAILTVANRSLHNAGSLATEFDGVAAPFHALPQLLAESDVVLSTTGSLEPILSVSLAEWAVAGRPPDRPLVIVDLAVPRDVEPGVGDIDGIRLFGLEELHDLSRASMEGRLDEVEQAEGIVDDEVAQYQRTRQSERVRPVLAALWQRIEGLRQSELDRIFGDFEGVDDETRGRIEHLTGSLVRKILHKPSLGLRSASLDGRFDEYSNVVRRLFALDDDTGDASQPDEA